MIEVCCKLSVWGEHSKTDEREDTKLRKRRNTTPAHAALARYVIGGPS